MSKLKTKDVITQKIQGLLPIKLKENTSATDIKVQVALYLTTKEDYDEIVEALRWLWKDKTRPVQTVQDLLKKTRSLRTKRLRETPSLSIIDILEEYPTQNR